MSGLFSPNQSFRGSPIGVDTRNLYLDLSHTSLVRLWKFNLNISSWDVSNVTDMNEMFLGAGAFNQPLNKWDVSNVTDMSEMFAAFTHEGGRVYPVSFNQDISTWDVSNVNSTLFALNGSLNDRYNPFVRAEVKQPNVWHNEGVEKLSTENSIIQLWARPINYSSNAQMDTVIGFSDGEAQSYSDLGIIVRFSRDGTIDARDADSYRHIEEYRYAKNELVKFYIKINFDTHTYSVWLETNTYGTYTIAKDFKFRTEQSDLSKINNVAQFSNREGAAETK